MITGKESASLLESLVVSDVKQLQEGQGIKLGLYCIEQGFVTPLWNTYIGVLLHCAFIAGTLSLITNDAGGIVDDCIITRAGEKSFYVVSNASRREVVLDLLKVMFGGCVCMCVC